MTLALGVTQTIDAPSGAVHVPPGELALVTVPQDAARTARERLALQVAYARHLPSFLPFRVRRPIETADALQHVAAKAEDLTAKLLARRGLVQVTVALSDPVDAAAGPDQTWLRRRASRSEALSVGTAFLADRLSHIGASTIRRNDRQGVVHLVGDRTLLSRVRAALGDLTPGGDADPPARLSAIVTGPWPISADFKLSAVP